MCHSFRRWVCTVVSDDRISVDEMLLIVTDAFSQRSTCSRAQIGAVLARDGRVVSSGYNGAPARMNHCDHECNCMPLQVVRLTTSTVDIAKSHTPECQSLKPCTISVHAEANAIVFAARHGLATEGTTLYSSQTPCMVCAQLLLNAGIVRAVAAFPYRDLAGWKLLADAGIECLLWRWEK